MKSDVKSYYASIDHKLLRDILAEYVDDDAVLHLVWQYLNRTVTFGENYREIRRGISLGCPLSPLMAALFLKPLDDAMKESDVFYIRFMDDWVVIVPTRWKLRRAVASVNRVLNALQLEKHPDKTFIGRAERGFDFLGYQFTPVILTVAKKTVERFVERAARLYEQEPEGSPGGSFRFWEYVKRWLSWVTGGVSTRLSLLNVTLHAELKHPGYLPVMCA